MCLSISLIKCQLHKAFYEHTTIVHMTYDPTTITDALPGYMALIAIKPLPQTNVFMAG